VAANNFANRMMAAKYRILKPMTTCSVCNQWWDDLDFWGGVWVRICHTYSF